MALKTILRHLWFVASETGVIPAGSLIKDPPQSCGQTLKSNRFLHHRPWKLQKSTTNRPSNQPFVVDIRTFFRYALNMEISGPN